MTWRSRRGYRVVPLTTPEGVVYRVINGRDEQRWATADRAEAEAFASLVNANLEAILGAA